MYQLVSKPTILSTTSCQKENPNTCKHIIQADYSTKWLQFDDDNDNDAHLTQSVINILAVHKAESRHMDEK